jgi:sialic acid synthase SpsE
MTFIIADVGSNWSTLEDLTDSINMVKACGADAVKFQFYSHKDLYGFGSLTPNLKPEWLPILKQKADLAGIEFMCTAFSLEGLKLIDPLVKRHKVASSELPYEELIGTIYSLKKPVILSTGAASLGDIKLALSYLKNPTLLYCVSNYPARNVNLFGIDKLKAEFGLDVGYSCHTDEWVTCVEAVVHHSASVIEKHFKLRDMPHSGDNPHSLEPQEFKKMVKAIKGAYAQTFPDPQEVDAVEKYKRRLIATQDIQPGQVLEYGKNYGCYRSFEIDREGLSGFASYHVSGKSAAKHIKAGAPVTPKCIA